MKYFLLIIFAGLLSVPSFAQTQNYTHGTREQINGWHDALQRDMREVDMTTIAGYSRYLGVAAEAYVDSLYYFHGKEVSISEAFDWLIESNPEINIKKIRGYPRLVVTRPGTGDWVYNLYIKTPNLASIDYQSYGFYCSQSITTPVRE